MARPYAFSVLLSLVVALPLHAGELPEASATDTTALPPLADPDTPPLAAVEDELQPPAVDAYFDVTFTRTDLATLGYEDTAGGYRFIAGFRLENVKAGAWSVAPEVGYFRIGKSERSSESFTPNALPGFNLLRTDTYTVDASGLDFGARLAREVNDKASGFVRLGLSVTHVNSKRETSDRFIASPPDPSQDFDGAPVASPSSTAVGMEPYGAAGLALKLGTVPSLYAEYGLRMLDGEKVDTLAVGFLLNF